MKSDLSTFFEERLLELQSYVALLEALDRATQSGPPRLEGATSPITVEQQRILYSSVYLQLYNLVEATVSRCVVSVTTAAEQSGEQPARLVEPLRKEWVRAMARTHVDMGVDRRLEAAVLMFDHLVAGLRVGDFDIEIGGGGNWDDESIEKVSKRIGCQLDITVATKSAVKRHLLNDLGALKLVKLRRNQLAHGAISFVDCSDSVAVSDLTALVRDVGSYLRETVASFENFVTSQSFLSPALATT